MKRFIGAAVLAALFLFAAKGQTAQQTVAGTVSANDAGAISFESDFSTGAASDTLNATIDLYSYRSNGFGVRFDSSGIPKVSLIVGIDFNTSNSDTAQVQIEMSPNNSDWFVVSAFASNVLRDAATADYKVITFTPLSARYLRVRTKIADTTGGNNDVYVSWLK